MNRIAKGEAKEGGADGSSTETVSPIIQSKPLNDLKGQLLVKKKAFSISTLKTFQGHKIPAM